jgi:hypothetical protein
MVPPTPKKPMNPGNTIPNPFMTPPAAEPPTQPPPLNINGNGRPRISSKDLEELKELTSALFKDHM